LPITYESERSLGKNESVMDHGPISQKGKNVAELLYQLKWKMLQDVFQAKILANSMIEKLLAV
jgi:hypothetical protein